MKLTYVGPSDDGRTNKWSVTCECKEVFRPTTTLFSRAIIRCPYCQQFYYVNYNDQFIMKATEDSNAN